MMTCYLYDEDGGASPLLEEQVSGSTASVSIGYSQAADALRARYAPSSDGLYHLFQWDPQGSLVQRQTGGPGGNTSYYALDTAIYDSHEMLPRPHPQGLGAILGSVRFRFRAHSPC